MKLHASILLTAAVFSIFAGCCCPPSGPQTLTTSDGLAQITVTDGMTETALMEENPDTTLQVGNIFREIYALVISEPSTIPELTDFDLDDYTELIRAQHSSNLTNANVSEVEKTTINGHPARKWTVTGSADGVDAFFCLRGD